MAEYNLTHAYNVVRYTADGISGIAIVGTLLGYLPSIAALAGIIWYGVQIYESKTVQKGIRRWRLKRRVARLAAKERANDDLQPS